MLNRRLVFYQVFLHLYFDFFPTFSFQYSILGASKHARGGIGSANQYKKMRPSLKNSKSKIKYY